MAYEAPKVTELGSIADLTSRGDFAWDYDGRLFRGRADGTS